MAAVEVSEIRVITMNRTERQLKESVK